MKIGFTGTRNGMSEHQKKELYELLRKFRMADYKIVNEFHHGDCLGSDAQAHDIANAAGYWIVIHPPGINDLRAYKIGHCEKKPKPYLVRNHDIVNECDIILAAPSAGPEKFRGSGTWATIRYARKIGKEVIILDRSPV